MTNHVLNLSGSAELLPSCGGSLILYSNQYVSVITKGRAQARGRLERSSLPNYLAHFSLFSTEFIDEIKEIDSSSQ